MGLQADVSAVPVQFSHPYLFWALWANIPAVLAHFIPRASSAHLLLLHLFYSHRFLLNPLGFLGPTTTSLPLITLRAYWPLSQPNGFTNSFLGRPRPIYFFFISYFSHGFTISLLRLSWPIYFLFTSYYSCESAGHYSCHSSMLGLLYYLFLLTFFILLGFFCYWAFCQK